MQGIVVVCMLLHGAVLTTSSLPMPHPFDVADVAHAHYAFHVLMFVVLVMDACIQAVAPPAVHRLEMIMSLLFVVAVVWGVVACVRLALSPTMSALQAQILLLCATGAQWPCVLSGGLIVAWMCAILITACSMGRNARQRRAAV